jgi:hypothetical protein
MISNGFDNTQVLNALTGRLGWLQPPQPQYTGQISTPNLASSSATGRSFQSFHPMATVDNIFAAQEYEGLTLASLDGLLTQFQKDVIGSMLTAVFNMPQLIDSTLLFDRLRRSDLIIQNTGQFVGWRLWTSPGNFATMVCKIGLMLTGSIAGLNLYLFQDDTLAPVKVFPVNVVGNSQTIIDLTSENIVLNYLSPSAQGGVWYLGYFQDDLQAAGVQAIDQYVSEWNRSLAFGYTSYEVPRLPGVYDFSRVMIPYSYRTFGMNLEIQSYRDFTNTIIRNPHLFDELIGLMMAVRVISTINYSIRTDFSARANKLQAQQLYTDLSQAGPVENAPYVAGLKKQISREMERVHSNFFPKPGIITTRPPAWSRQSPFLMG